MQEIAISEFKAKCLEVLKQVSRTRKPIRVTRFGKPIADVMPPAVAQPRAALIDSMKDSMEIVGDIIAPANDENEWEVLRD